MNKINMNKVQFNNIIPRYNIHTYEKNKYYDLLHGVYAHGKLEDILQLNLLYAKVSNKFFARYNKFKNHKKYAEKINLNILYNNKEYQCILYIWQSNHRIKTLLTDGNIKDIYMVYGYLVLAGDADAENYAQERYDDFKCNKNNL